MFIQTFSGEENFRGASCTVRLFFLPTPATAEVPLHIACRDPRSGLTQRGIQFVQAKPGSEVCGKWLDARYDIKEGASLKLWMRKRVGGGALSDTVQLMVRMRETAALRRVKLILTGAEQASMTAGYIEGRFDVIPPKLMPSLGYPETDWDALYDEDRQAGMLEIAVLEREESPFLPPTVKNVVTATGENVTVRVKRGGRKINLKPTSGE